MPQTLPDDNAIAAAVDQAYAKMLRASGGRNADYIPILATVPTELAGIAVVTREGAVYEAGDSRHGFAIQSISKVATLALVMEAIGPEAVRDKVGMSPTGLPFNSVLAIELNDGKPMSPLVNAGAIATASLVDGDGVEARWAKILSIQSRLAGAELAMSEAVNASEQATNYHNRAIAWLLYEAGTCYSDPMQALDLYTRQCSTMASVVQLATMGATLANGGVNPVSGERVVSADNVPRILAQMMMEGLYTASGEFASRVGLPGKSGVGGGILAVAPGKLAIAGFSPPLDKVGNSVRGLAGISSIAHALDLDLFAG